MAETDSDYMSQVKVLALAEAPTGYEIEAADNAGATRPSIDSNGVITWRPIPADTGVRRFNLVVKGNNATTARLPFTIQVGPWRTMVDQTFDQSGGDVEPRRMPRGFIQQQQSTRFEQRQHMLQGLVEVGGGV